MIQSLENLPQSLAQCHEMIRELFGSVAKHQLEISALNDQLRQLLRHRYGQRADRIDPNNPGLFTCEEILASLLGQEESPPAPVPSEEEIHYTRKKPSRGHGRNGVPDHLPVEEIIIDLPAEEKQCGQCGDEKIRIGEERTRRVEYVPASLKVQEFVRITYACANECSGEVITANKPLSPIEKGVAGPGLLAQVAVSKYGDHLPLHRQEDIFSRHGYHLARSTQADWMRPTRTAGTMKSSGRRT